MALELVSPRVASRTEELRRQFQANEPFRHVVIDDFLEPAFCRRLCAEFPAFDPARARNEMGEVGRKAVFPDIARLGPAYARLDRMLAGREYLDLVSAITAIPDLLYDPEYAGGGAHENLDGQELDPHVDFNYHPHRPLHRRLNQIIFLNEAWEEHWGGALQLHRDPWNPERDQTRTILPILNRCVFFETSQRTWHGFRRIELPENRKHISRRSIALYLYTKTRPAEEMAPSHGTVYVPRPLPETIQPGRTLGEDDVQNLRTLLARRDRQIQALYERELEFSSVISGILRSPSFRLGRLLTWPLRIVRERF